MKKQLYKLLIGLNIFIIILILLISGILLYFSSSENHKIFGYSAFLFHDNEVENNQQYSLLIVENENEPHVDDRVSFYVRDDYNNKIQFVDIITSITDGKAIFQNTEYTVSIKSDLFVGKVVAQNKLLGNILASTVNSKNTFLIYSVLIGFFVIISGGLVALWIIRSRREQSGELSDNPTEEDLLLAQDFSKANSPELAKGEQPQIRVEHKDGSVYPHGLSRPHLSKTNPLFEPRAARNRTTPPTNMGTKNDTSLNRVKLGDSSNEDEDIKLYRFDKAGNPVFAQSNEAIADEIIPHTIILSEDADTSELIKLPRCEDTLDDILREHTHQNIKSHEPEPSLSVEVSITQPASVVNEYEIDTNFDFDAIVNDIIHKTEEDFFKKLDEK